MATSKEYLNYVLEQLQGIEDIAYRRMMGEYVLYYKGKVFGGIYDNRLLIKPTQSAKKLLPNALYDIPYAGAKEMIMLDCSDNKGFLIDLLDAMETELPAPKPKKKKNVNLNLK